MKLSDVILPLEWNVINACCMKADSPFGGVYEIVHGFTGGRVELVLPRDSDSKAYDSLEAAQLAAQQHYEAAVRAIFKPKVFE